MSTLTTTRPQSAPAAPWALLSLCLSMLMSSLDTSIANAGLPTLAGAFGASFQAVQWVVLAYLLAITTLIVSAGRLGACVGAVMRLVVLAIMPWRGRGFGSPARKVQRNRGLRGRPGPGRTGP